MSSHPARPATIGVAANRRVWSKTKGAGETASGKPVQKNLSGETEPVGIASGVPAVARDDQISAAEGNNLTLPSGEDALVVGCHRLG